MLVVVGINEELQMIRVLVIPLMMMVICGVVILAAKQSVHGTADSGWAFIDTKCSSCFSLINEDWIPFFDDRSAR